MDNEQYRRSRGTDKPFDGSRAQAAWDKLREERRAAEAALRIARSLATLAEMDRPLAEQEQQPKPTPVRKPRQAKERKVVGKDGRVLVCSTEKKRMGDVR